MMGGRGAKGGKVKEGGAGYYGSDVADKKSELKKLQATREDLEKKKDVLSKTAENAADVAKIQALDSKINSSKQKEDVLDAEIKHISLVNSAVRGDHVYWTTADHMLSGLVRGKENGFFHVMRPMSNDVIKVPMGSVYKVVKP